MILVNTLKNIKLLIARFLAFIPRNLIVLGLNILYPKLNYHIMRLNKLREGDVAIVVEVKGNSEVRRKLLDMGIVKGAEIKMVRNAPLKDPIEFELKGYCLSLRRKEAENVIVEVKK